MSTPLYLFPSKIDDLRRQATSIGTDCAMLAAEVLDNPDFALWIGSNTPSKHHHGEGGLQYHTWEVIQLAFANCTVLGLTDIDPTALFLSGLYHDVGKVKDYGYTVGEHGEKWWSSTPHHRLINHMNRSAIMWTAAVAKHRLTGHSMEDEVLHAILAHHGDYGSSVFPKTRLAWLLHLADQTSARMEDCGRLDLAKRQ